MKELKGPLVRFTVFSLQLIDKWNPVKELKGDRRRIDGLEHAYGWNPVKELKDDIIQLIVARRVQRVESGEGIESGSAPAFPLQRRSVESGEGIERMYGLW